MLQVRWRRRKPAARPTRALGCSEENVLFYFAVERYKDDKRFDMREQLVERGAACTAALSHRALTPRTAGRRRRRRSSELIYNATEPGPSETESASRTSSRSSLPPMPSRGNSGIAGITPMIAAAATSPAAPLRTGSRTDIGPKGAWR